VSTVSTPTKLAVDPVAPVAINGMPPLPPLPPLPRPTEPIAAQPTGGNPTARLPPALPGRPPLDNAVPEAEPESESEGEPEGEAENTDHSAHDHDGHAEPEAEGNTIEENRTKQQRGSRTQGNSATSMRASMGAVVGSLVLAVAVP